MKHRGEFGKALKEARVREAAAAKIRSGQVGQGRAFETDWQREQSYKKAKQAARDLHEKSHGAIVDLQRVSKDLIDVIGDVLTQATVIEARKSLQAVRGAISSLQELRNRAKALDSRAEKDR